MGFLADRGSGGVGAPKTRYGAARGGFGGLSRNTLFFGVTSFLVEVSSEMIDPIMPLFLMNVLKADAVVIGLIEGCSEVVVALMSAISGYVSDKFGKHKAMSVSGYFISAFMKLFFVIAGTWQNILGLRIVERFGKGLRGVPRDVIMAHSDRKEMLGRAFGYRKMMDAFGAILGPLIAAVIIALLLPRFGEEQTYRSVFLLAVIPAVLGVVILSRFVKELHVRKMGDGKEALRNAFGNRGYKSMVIVGALFGIAQFGNAFFILKAQDITGNVLMTLFGYIVYNISYALFALPAGFLTDRLGGRKVMALGYALFALTVLGFAFSTDYLFLVFFVTFGMVAAILDTTPRTFISRISDDGNKGTSMGIYQGITGFLLLPANIIAGLLWNVNILGFRGTFVFSFAVSALAALLMLAAVKMKRD
ncbi:MAG: MFS transporter [Candidatus Micrarchaeia archaeon]